MSIHSLFKLIRKNFTAGVVFVLPIWITVLLVKALINVLDDMFSLFPAPLRPATYLAFPGIEIIIALLVLVFVGFLVNNFIGANIIKLSDHLVSKIPVVRTVYQAVKHLTTGIVGDKKIFSQVVQVEFPIKGLHFIGFVTGEDTWRLKPGGERVLKIFIPTTPNPTSGFFCFAPESSVKKMDISVEEAFRLVISAGYANST